VLPLIIFRITVDRPRFNEPLEVIKFICKEFWAELFQKQVDNLKTNHRVRNPCQHPFPSLIPQ
jgi:hypothetical protein